MYDIYYIRKPANKNDFKTDFLAGLLIGITLDSIYLATSSPAVLSLSLSLDRFYSQAYITCICIFVPTYIHHCYQLDAFFDRTRFRCYSINCPFHRLIVQSALFLI